MSDYHMGRSFHGTRLEDDCPCPKEPCGLVGDPVEECEEHPLSAGKTIRQMHSAEQCPGKAKQG